MPSETFNQAALTRSDTLSHKQSAAEPGSVIQVNIGIDKVSNKTRRYSLLVIVLLSFAISWWMLPELATPKFLTPTELIRVSDTIPVRTTHSAKMTHDTPIYTSAMVSDSRTLLVHASSMTRLANGNLLAVWFGGSREGATDVEIHRALFDAGQQRWIPQAPLITPKQTQYLQQRYVRKVGNAVVALTPGERIVVFYVTVSLGGWATSSINLMVSDDRGQSWSRPHKLVTSPFFNLSTLVKGTPQFYQDGTIALPVYHEMAGKFGELLRITTEGEIISKKRLAIGRDTLQPVLMIENEHSANVLMRYAGDNAPFHAVTNATRDGGLHWSKPLKTELANPNSALSGLVLGNGNYLVVANDMEDSRFRLSLLLSTDHGISWKPLHRFEDQSRYEKSPVTIAEHRKVLIALLEKDGIALEKMDETVQEVQKQVCGPQYCKFQFDYPYLIESSPGVFDLSYTWNKHLIKHVRFNRVWLETLL